MKLLIGGGAWRVERPKRPAPAGEQSFLLDVRTPKEFDLGHIPGAVNIPVDELRDRVGELPSDRTIAAYCQVGQRGFLATRILMQAGLSAANVGGRVHDVQSVPPGRMRRAFDP